MLGMTLNEINTYAEGVYEKEESEINKGLYLAHQSAVLNNLAFSGKDFPKEPPTINRNSNSGGNYDRNKGDNLEALHNLARKFMSSGRP